MDGKVLPLQRMLSLYSVEAIREKCRVGGIDAKAFEESSNYLANSLNSFMAYAPLAELLRRLALEHPALHAHSLGVGLYTLMIARKMRFESSTIIYTLAMAGIFHDISEMESTYKGQPGHVERSADILRRIAGVPREVLHIVLDHHEDDLGQGYPLGTPRLKLHPLSRLLHTADIFVNRAFASQTNPGASAALAIAQMEELDGASVNLLSLNALKQLLVSRKAAMHD